MEESDKVPEEGTENADEKENDIIAEFEKHVYDLQQMLEISRSFCSAIEFPSLIQSILYVAMAQMRVTGAGLFVEEDFDDDYFKLSENYSGIDVNPSIEYKIPKSSPLVKFISESANVFTLEELKKWIPDCRDIQTLESLKPSLIVPLMLKNKINGILIMGERILIDEISSSYTGYERDEIQTIASLASVAVQNSFLIEQSSTDMMTKLKLKFYFYNILENKLDEAFERDKKIGVIMFDIDFFKKFNDTYGHACGDFVLKTVAGIIRGSIRSRDLASRYGGEEFTVMLPNAGKNEAVIVAERIRNRIEKAALYYEGHDLSITISAGVSIFSVDENPVRSAKVFVDQADKALYVSKQNGRNRVSVFNPANDDNEHNGDLSSYIEKTNERPQETTS